MSSEILLDKAKAIGRKLPLRYIPNAAPILIVQAIIIALLLIKVQTQQNSCGASFLSDIDLSDTKFHNSKNETESYLDDSEPTERDQDDDDSVIEFLNDAVDAEVRTVLRGRNHGLVEGEQMLHGYQAKTDGNYAMHVTFRGRTNLIFSNLTVGNCVFARDFRTTYIVGTNLEMEEAIQIFRPGSHNPYVSVDLERCHSNQAALEKIEDWETAIDFLNRPVPITFGLIKAANTSSLHGHGLPETEIAASYAFEFSAHFGDRYKIIYDSGKRESIPYLFNERGFPRKVLNNIQFEIEETDDIEMKKQFGLDATLKILPTNGFNNHVTLFTAEECFLRDPWTEKKVKLWAIGKYDRTDCFKEVMFDRGTNYWKFGLNFTRVLGYQTKHRDYVVSCAIRLCGNVPGNQCGEILEKCGYSGSGPSNFVVPTEPVVIP